MPSARPVEHRLMSEGPIDRSMRQRRTLDLSLVCSKCLYFNAMYFRNFSIILLINALKKCAKSSKPLDVSLITRRTRTAYIYIYIGKQVPLVTMPRPIPTPADPFDRLCICGAVDQTITKTFQIIPRRRTRIYYISSSRQR